MMRRFKLLRKILLTLVFFAALFLCFYAGNTLYTAYQNKRSLKASGLDIALTPDEQEKGKQLAAGELLSKNLIDLQALTPLWEKVTQNDTLKAEFSHLAALDFYTIVYKSDSLLVNGIIAEPKREGKFPVVIFNRGGNKQTGSIAKFKTLFTLISTSSTLASAGYVVIAPCYRENDEFGGNDIHDVLNLTKTVNYLPKAAPERLGMFGWSRGGMMTYLALKNADNIKTAVIGNGPTDLPELLIERPEMETEVCAKLIPNYSANKKEALEKRSVIYWADELNKDASLLILCGTEDKRVNPKQAFKIAEKLAAINYDYTLKSFDTDHKFTGKTEELNRVLINWFDKRL